MLINLLGHLSKETKEATGLNLVDDIVTNTGIVSTVYKRWCLLLSSCPLVTSKFSTLLIN